MVIGEEDVGGETRWVRADGRPLKPFDLKIYARAGLSPPDALEWADAGFEPYQAEQLREAGADLDLARRIRDQGFDHRHLRYARDHDETVEAAAAAHAAGFDPGLLDRARRLGVGDDDIARLRAPAIVAEVADVLEAGATFDAVSAWRAEGLDLPACRDVLRAGTPLSDVAQAVRWSALFPDPLTRRAWKATRLSCAEATGAAQRGSTPLDFLEGRTSASGAPRRQDRPRVIVSAFQPEPRTDSGSPLHPTVLREAGGSPSAALLRAFGYTVKRETPRSRFLAEHSGSLLVFFNHRRARTGVAAITDDPAGARLSLLRWRESEPTVSVHPDVPAAVAALATECDDRQLSINRISDRTAGTTSLLATVRQLIEHLADRATINGRPAPGAAQEEIAPSQSSAQANGHALLLEVARCSPDGTVRFTRLVSTDAGLVMVTPRGREQVVNAPDVLSAVAHTSALRDLRPNEATIITTTPDERPAEQLVPLLRLRGTDLLVSELAVPVPDEMVLNEWNDVPYDYGLSQRALFINGERWVILPPAPGIKPRILPSDPREPWQVSAAFQNVWASFSCTEEASRAGGTSRWRLGPLDTDVLASRADLDEIAPELTVRRIRRSRETEVVAWVRELSSELDGVDIVMFLAKIIAGELDGHSVPADLFDERASQTLICDLEVEGNPRLLIRALRRAGRGDAADIAKHGREASRRRRARRWSPSVSWELDPQGIRYSGQGWRATLGPLPALHRADWPEEPDTVLSLEVDRPYPDDVEANGLDLDDDQCLWYLTLDEETAGVGKSTLDEGTGRNHIDAKAKCIEAAIGWAKENGWTDGQIAD